MLDCTSKSTRSMQAGGLDDAAQLGLAPDAAGAVGAERRRERLGRGAQALLGLGRGLQLLGELAVLQVALRLELGDLRLHLGERLLDGGERLEHAALGLLARLARLLLGAVLLDDLALLLLGREDLLAERLGGGLGRGELLAEQRLRGLLARPHLGELRLVARLDEGGVVADRRARGRAACRPHGDGEAAEQAADEEADEECEEVHVDSVAAASDIAGERARPGVHPRRPGRMPLLQRHRPVLGAALARGDRADRAELHPGDVREALDVVGLVPLRRVHDDRGARLGVGERVVVREVLEAGRHRRDREAVGLEVVGLAGDLQAAERAEVGHLESHRLGGLRDHGHVEPGVVRDEHVVARRTRAARAGARPSRGHPPPSRA